MENLENTISIIEQLDSLVPQLAKFIKQFHEVIITNDINVVTDGDGNLSGHPLKSMPEAAAKTAMKKIGIIDNLINTHQDSISELFKKGFASTNDPNYISSLQNKLIEFKKINATYKH
jgi:hypothetical protein